MFRCFSRGRFFAGGVLTGFVCAALAPEVAAQQQASPPDFSLNQVGWVAMGEIAGVAGGPPILHQDPAHAYVPNNIGRQPTYRLADLTNPNLKPWVKERMKKDNDEVLRKDCLHGALKLHAGGRSCFRDVPCPAGLLYPDTAAGSDDLFG